MTPTLKRIQIARTTLLLDQPFFGMLALQLVLLEDPTCGTAWTDGCSMGFNPGFVATLNQDELTAVLAHEVMHCAAGHCWRRGARDARQWNVAADFAINAVLRDAGFALPDSALLDTQYNGKWAEWIYDRLPVPPPDDGSGTGTGPGPTDPSGLGEVRDAPDDAAAPSESEWQQLTTQSMQAAQARGKLPASLKRELTDLSAARVDWRSLLRKYVSEVVRADYTWTRPNPRYIAHGLYLPSLRSIACGRIAVAIDTSGSIDKVLLQQFASELQGIAADVQPSCTDVLYCDTRVHRVDHFDRDDTITLNATGGGGTSFEPVFERIAASEDTPVVLVYLTDMYGSFPTDAPDYPVIWCSSSEITVAPFGDVVRCNS